MTWFKVAMVVVCAGLVSQADAAGPSPGEPKEFYESLQQQNVIQTQRKELLQQIQNVEQDLDRAARKQTVEERKGSTDAARSRLAAAIAEARTLQAPNSTFPPAVRDWPAVQAIVAAQQRSQEAFEKLKPIEGRLNATDDMDVNQVLNEIKAVRGQLGSAMADVEHNLKLIEEKYQPLAGVVVSGGVSLGSYQAGFLHYYTQFMLAHGRSIDAAFAEIFAGKTKQNPRGFQIATGASAGSINAFLAGIAGCRLPVSDPTQSLFYSTWIPVGLDGLVHLKDVKVDGLLSRAPIQNAINNIRHLWDEKHLIAGWDTSMPCQSYMGFSATRMQARTIDVRENGVNRASGGEGAHAAVESVTRLQKQTEQFVFGMAKNGGAPTFAAFRPTNSIEETALSEFFPVLGANIPVAPGKPKSIAIDLGDVMQLLAASSSFPLAFPPVRLKYSLWKPANASNGGVHLEYEGTQSEARFIDGGVFDNAPLGLAINMHRWLQDKNINLPSRFLFLSSGTIGWRKGDAAYARRTQLAQKNKGGAGEDDPDDDAPSTIFDEYLPFLSDFVGTAENTQLVSTIESNYLVGREVPARMVPIMGEQLAHFFAFFEKDFRRFDFYIGMVDALEHIQSRSREAFDLVTAQKALHIDSALFDCFAEHRRLMRIGAAKEPTDISQCEALVQGKEHNMMALLVTSTKLKQYTEQDGYNPKKEFETLLSLLQDSGYTYHDLSYRGTLANKDTVVPAIRDQMQELFHVMGSKQHDVLPKHLVWISGKAAANYFDYRPVPLQLSLGGDMAGGGLQIDAGLNLFGRVHSLRLGAFVRGTDLGRRRVEFTSAADTRLSVTLETGAGLTAQWAVSPSIQLELGGTVNLRLISSFAQLLERPHVMQLGYEGSLTVVGFQRLFMAASVAGYPDAWDLKGRGTLPGDLNRTWFHLILGWRFLFL